MLVTNTYCSGSHGDYSHPTLDLRKSYSRFTPLFLALHKSSPPPLSCVMRCMREGGKMVKGDTTSKQMKLQTKRTCKTENLYFFFTQKNMFRQERMVSKNVRTKSVVQGFWMGHDKKYKGDFHSEQQNNVDHVVENFFSRTLYCYAKLDHWTGSPARLCQEWINKLCFHMNLGTLISFYCDLTRFILMIVSY